MMDIASFRGFRLRCGALLASPLLLAACATPGNPVAAQSPRLALAPAALGCDVAVQQRLSVQLPGKPVQQLDALLEVDAQAVRLAFFWMGQGVGTMVWDGRQWDQQLSRQWPAQLAPEQVLSDLQFAFWPAAAVQKALQAPWSLDVTTAGRRLLRDGREHLRAEFMGETAVEIIYSQGPFVLRVESPGGARLCAPVREAP